MSNWFDVDKSGLKNIQSEKDKFFIVSELVSNSFDEDIKVCEVNVWKDQTSSGISASYTMGWMTLAGAMNEVDNMDGGATKDFEGYEFNLKFAF